jgi:protein-serine/threonine kinase
VVTVEKAAAAKIFFECHYNELLSNTVTPRSLRRRELEGALYEDVVSPPSEKEAQRHAWARRETDHLREIRKMKSRTRNPESFDQMASMYEVVKVLGKGSFGVVRLVREKATDRLVSRESVQILGNSLTKTQAN